MVGLQEKVLPSHQILAFPVELDKFVLPKGASILWNDEVKVVVEFTTNFKVNGTPVTKVLEIYGDGQWLVKVSGIVVDLPSDERSVRLQKVDFPSFLEFVNKLTLCEGHEAPARVRPTKLFIEHIQYGSDKVEQRLRPSNCQRIVPYSSNVNECAKCIKIKSESHVALDVEPFPTPSQSPLIHVPQNPLLQSASAHSEPVDDDDVRVVLDPSDDKDIRSIIDLILPKASEQFKKLVLDQRTAQSHQDKRQVRWDKDFIQLCLTIYSQSPSAYETLKSSNSLMLPSGRLLAMYKNSIPDNSGLNPEMFEWMKEEADRREIKTIDRRGGLLIDEMSIQKDLQLERSGSGFRLIGFSATCKEAESCRKLQNKSEQKQLADHALQVVFLGFNGFRFPVAHFPTTTASATELYILFWRIIQDLEQFGFSVAYVNLDGAITNRQFMNINFPHSTPESHLFLANSPIFHNDRVSFIMDYSHVMKKIRNSALASGTGDKSTRKMANAGNPIVWQTWEEAYEWDCKSPIKVHRNLTEEHIYIRSDSDNAKKMRNHLAEDVLNCEMLDLVLAYKSSLGNDGSTLDGVVEFLKATSVMITFFRDKRPLKSSSDVRLTGLKNSLDYFNNWEASVQKTRRSKELLTDETRQDIRSCIQGFLSLVILLEESGPFCLVPARINSDLVENTFCQQRGKKIVLIKY